MIKKFVFALFLSVLIFGSASFVFAQSGSAGAPPGPSGGTTINLGDLNPLGSACKDIECILGKILDFILTIVMAIMPFIIMYGAYQIITAGGDPKQFQTGGKTILYASIGFIVALLAKNLVSILLSVVDTTIGS